MVSLKHIIFLISIAVLTSCGKNQFELDFELPQEITDNYNVTYYASSNKGGKTIQAVASVREGKCQLDGITQLPTLIYVTSRRSSYPLVIYVKKGEIIKISGEGNDPLGWNVEGNEINTDLSEWRMENLEFMKEVKTDSINCRIASFVSSNSENPVSLVLMQCYYDRKLDERDYNMLMASLKGEAKSSDWLKITARSDQLYHSYFFPAKLESLVMRSIKNGTDTLRPNGVKPLMLLFWQTGYTERKAIIDSIKILEKEFPDTSRIIADICLDIDSVGWKNAIKKDSVYEEMKRFWAPMGLADPTIAKLKVNSIPYFIVFDKEGKQSYRGKDLAKSMETFRKLYNSTDSIKE